MSMEIKPFKIRDVEIKPPLVLSPMAGVTDISFRRLLKQRGGIGLTVSEFISVEGLTRNNPKSKRQMRFYDNERPFAVQIFGGQGYFSNEPYERMMRDARINMIGEGANDVLKVFITVVGLRGVGESMRYLLEALKHPFREIGTLMRFGLGQVAKVRNPPISVMT